jgi:hypothetical protein
MKNKNMQVRLIKGNFFVSSASSKVIHKVDQDLKCSCKGFTFHNHCKHQKRVIEYIESGATVDIARTPVTGYVPYTKPRTYGRVFLEQNYGKEYVRGLF